MSANLSPSMTPKLELVPNMLVAFMVVALAVVHVRVVTVEVVAVMVDAVKELAVAVPNVEVVAVRVVALRELAEATPRVEVVDVNVCTFRVVAVAAPREEEVAVITRAEAPNGKLAPDEVKLPLVFPPTLSCRAAELDTNCTAGATEVVNMATVPCGCQMVPVTVPEEVKLEAEKLPV